MLKIKRDLATKPEAFKIEYDSIYGYPSKASIDFIKQMADDEYSLRISNFREEPVEPTPLSWETYQPEFFAYTLKRDCFCPPEVRGPFSVYAGLDTVYRVYRLIGPDSIRVSERVSSYSVDSLLVEFDRIAGANPSKRSLAFNPVFGFPDSGRTDPVAQTIDDEYGFSINGFYAATYWPYWIRN